MPASRPVVAQGRLGLVRIPARPPSRAAGLPGAGHAAPERHAGAGHAICSGSSLRRRLSERGIDIQVGRRGRGRGASARSLQADYSAMRLTCMPRVSVRMES